MIEGKDYHRGFLVGLAYAIAQNNQGKAIMGPFTIPAGEYGEEISQDTLEDVFNETLNAEAGCFLLHTERQGDWLKLWLATTENHESFNEDEWNKITGELPDGSRPSR